MCYIYVYSCMCVYECLYLCTYLYIYSWHWNTYIVGKFTYYFDSNSLEFPNQDATVCTPTNSV